ncbi:MAG TPA: ABC transporter permease [Anaerolineaceae bacterium]|nr:ABC transporter permease [Anaerolineaceae bacterium]
MTEITNRGPLADGLTGEHSHHVHIEPSRGWVSLSLRDLWIYRELLYFLTWRDIKVRYKQTALGVVWAILQPVLTMVVFTFIFGKLANLGPKGVPYPIFSFVAVLPWQYFSQSLNLSSNSLVGNAAMITKVYFPRLIIPISSVLGGLVDFAVAFVILIGMMVYYGIRPTFAIVFLPLFLLLALITALGVGLWLATLNVQYRDVRYIVPFLTQFWMYATPAIYSSDLLQKLGEPWISLSGLNPLMGVVEGFRWAMLGMDPPGPMIAVSAVIAVLILVSGLFYFRRVEKGFADVI